MRLSIILLIIFAGLACHAQELDPDCLSRMKKGIFKSENSAVMEVIRTSKEHVEVLSDGNSKLFHSIVWENDSTYTLTMKRTVNAATCLRIGDKMKKTITTCTGNEYATKTVSVYCGDSQECMVKVN